MIALDSALSDEEFEQGIDAINQIFAVQCNPEESLVPLDDCCGKPLKVSLLDSNNVIIIKFVLAIANFKLLMITNFMLTCYCYYYHQI